jgi:uncharacterized protein (DUF2249 family)
MLVWYTSWRRARQGRQPRQLRHHIPREDRHDLVLHWLATIDHEGNRPLLANDRDALHRHHVAHHRPFFHQLAARVDPKIWRLGFLDTRGATDAADEQPWRGDDEGGDDHFQMARKQ